GYLFQPKGFVELFFYILIDPFTRQLVNDGSQEIKIKITVYIPAPVFQRVCEYRVPDRIRIIVTQVQIFSYFYIEIIICPVSIKVCTQPALSCHSFSIKRYPAFEPGLVQQEITYT